ncbi:MAG TPA: Lrp/AsnC family transcriptional regulator [Blastocatellia bacterium]|nr:Lrp/AsnC family transcriptional regulator [Blastocatellia bacterium]
MLDAIDYKLCELLQRRGRASQLELAQAVHLSQPAVAERIRKLEEQGVISGYAAHVNAKYLGKDITAFIGVLTNHPRYHDAFVKKVTAIEEVLECHRVAGTDSYLLKIKTENTSSLDALIARIRSIDGCERTQTTIVMATLKESTHVAPSQPESAAPQALSTFRKTRKQK